MTHSPALSARTDVHSPKHLAGLPLLRPKIRPDVWLTWCESRGAAIPLQGGPAFEPYYFMRETVAELGVCMAPWHPFMDDIRAGRLVAPLAFQGGAPTSTWPGAGLSRMPGWTAFATGCNSRQARLRPLEPGIHPQIPSNPAIRPEPLK